MLKYIGHSALEEIVDRKTFVNDSPPVTYIFAQKGFVAVDKREAWKQCIYQRTFPIEVQVAVLQRVPTMFFKSKQSIIREKLDSKPRKGSLSQKQDLKSKTSKKSKSTQSESKATKKPAVIKEPEKDFEKPEITVQCVVPLSKRDPIYGP